MRKRVDRENVALGNIVAAKREDVGGINRREIVTSALTGVAASLAGRRKAAIAKANTDAPLPSPPVELRCEHLINPVGVGLAKPRLSWRFGAVHQADASMRPTAWQVQVASNPKGFRRPDLWESGWVNENENGTLYRGKLLRPLQQCYWRVRVRDGAGRQSAWSEMAVWTVGFLSRSDWKAKWITDPILARPENYPRVPIHCYRSQTATRPDEQKWIVVDLGREVDIDAIELKPSRPDFLPADYRSFLYPVRFYVEAWANNNSMKYRVVDHTHADVPSPRPPALPVTRFKFTRMKARFVRIVCTQLAHWDCEYWAFSLGGIAVYSGLHNVATGAKVRCLDSVETDGISKDFLTKADNKVVFKTYPPGYRIQREDYMESPLCWDIAPPERLVVDVPGMPPGHTVIRTAMMRRNFNIPSEVRKAWLLITARGFHQTWINGRPISASRLAPGFTEFNQRVLYDMHDVTHLLQVGPNSVASLLGYGWYSGHMNLFNMCYIFGNVPKLLAQMEIELVDGRRMQVLTDEEWKSSIDGPVRYSDLLAGECQDLQRDGTAWKAASFDDSAWPRSHGISLDVDDALITWRICQSASVQKALRPVSSRQVGTDAWLFDFGQEIAGHCRLRTSGKAGSRVTLHHAECLTPEGTIDRANLWDALQRDDVILSGGSHDLFEPTFTYHGFRYVLAQGLSRRPDFQTLSAVPVRTDLSTTGKFICSNPLWNKIMEAVRWTQWNLLFDVPAGCAARAERLAWMGDIRDCVPTALMNMDFAAFISKYLQDARDSQLPQGQFCDITPHAQLRGSTICAGSPGWADAGVTMAWDLYVATGDPEVLHRHYDSMRRWVDYVYHNNPNFLWLKALGMNWGDWLSAGSPVTPKTLAATAYFAHSADIVGRSAIVIGEHRDAEKYHELYCNICRAFVKRWVRADGSIWGDAQGSYALALQFGLLPKHLINPAMDHLATAIAKNKGHLTTGFLSTRALMQALSRFGRHDLASRMLNQVSRPSWGYMVDTIGTTMWESFNAYIKGHIVKLSLCHWTWSSIGEWLWRFAAGLSPDEHQVGWRRFTVEPRPTSEIRWCQAHYRSASGPIELDWREHHHQLKLQLALPACSTALVKIPAIRLSDVLINRRPVVNFPAASHAQLTSGQAVFELPGGRYEVLTRTG